MTIKVRWGCLVGILVLCYVVASYPVNWHMMKDGMGWYDNNPDRVWMDGWKEMKGPDYCSRTFALVFSPFVVPFNGLYHLVRMTGPEPVAEQPR